MSQTNGPIRERLLYVTRRNYLLLVEQNKTNLSTTKTKMSLKDYSRIMKTDALGRIYTEQRRMLLHEIRGQTRF